MDYKQLLQKYIKHVIDCEGVSFIPSDENDRVRYATPSFAKEEIEELNHLQDSIDWDWFDSGI